MNKRPDLLHRLEQESALPALGAISLMIAVHVSLMHGFSLSPGGLLPVLEGVLLVGLVFAAPARKASESRKIRTAMVCLIALVNLMNGSALWLLLRQLLLAQIHNGPQLLLQALLIWLNNIIAFALWYWELDAGGPANRVQGKHTAQDFLFPQTSLPAEHHRFWKPHFLDYLYLAFTNSTAFSPTDVLPLSRWAKMLMLLQALMSLILVALVAARAVNILN